MKRAKRNRGQMSCIDVFASRRSLLVISVAVPSSQSLILEKGIQMVPALCDMSQIPRWGTGVYSPQLPSPENGIEYELAAFSFTSPTVRYSTV